MGVVVELMMQRWRGIINRGKK